MADNETTISEYGLAAPPVFRVTEEGDNTVIRDYATNMPRWVINGKIGGDTVKTMTTAERTAITPEAGQLIYDTDTDMLYVGDGITVGGNAVSPGSGGGDYTAGDGIRIIAGSTIAKQVYATIEDVDVTGASPAVTMLPGHGYSIDATTSKGITLNVDPNLGANQFALDEGHLEIFTANEGYIKTGANVELAERLEPDSINYCTVRFRRGNAIISVEDHIGGYIVVSATGTTAGTLPYALTSATQEYVAFDASLNGATVDLSGVTASGEKHVVGNGYTETTLTGAVDCGTSKFTVANLALQNVVVSGGTMTLGDAYIPSGSTVAVSGGGLAVEKVTGAGSESVINLNKEHIVYGAGGTAIFSGVTLTSGGTNTLNGGALNLYRANVHLSGVTISGNNASRGGGAYVNGATTRMVALDATNCVISGNNASNNGKDMWVSFDSVNLSACTLGDAVLDNNGGISFFGSCSVGIIKPAVTGSEGRGGTVTLTSGAILDLTGNTNAAPIAPGGGITFEAGGATVLVNGGTEATSSSYMMDNVNLPAGAKLTNTATVDLGGANIMLSANTTVSANGCTFSGGSTNIQGGAFNVSGNLSLQNAVITKCTATIGGGLFVFLGSASLENTTVSGNSRANASTDGADMYVSRGTVTASGCTIALSRIDSGGVVQLAGDCSIASMGGNASEDGSVIISSGASINLTSSIAPGGGITVLEGGCTVNGNAIAAGTYTSINSTGTPT